MAGNRDIDYNRPQKNLPLGVTSAEKEETKAESPTAGHHTPDCSPEPQQWKLDGRPFGLTHTHTHTHTEREKTESEREWVRFLCSCNTHRHPAGWLCKALRAVSPPMAVPPPPWMLWQESDDSFSCRSGLITRPAPSQLMANGRVAPPHPPPHPIHPSTTTLLLLTLLCSSRHHEQRPVSEGVKGGGDRFILNLKRKNKVLYVELMSRCTRTKNCFYFCSIISKINIRPT